MDSYRLYTVLAKKEIIDKLEELKNEEETIPFMAMDGSKTACIYFEKIDTEENLEMLARVVSDIVQKKIILEVSGKYLSSLSEMSILEKRELQNAFVTNHYISRKEGYNYITYYLIYVPILNLLRKEKEMHLEGWSRFRTAKYRILIRDLVEQFVEDYMTKKEIINFIKIIRESEFLSVPLEEVLHIVYDLNGRARLYNCEMKDVTLKYMNKYCSELILDSTLCEEDFYMNIIINVCPKKIVIHKKEYAKQPQFLKTLEMIFGQAVTYCEGCQYCEKCIT